MKSYTAEEVAEYCKCHVDTIRSYIKQGRLKASKPGRAYCITQAALDDFIITLENVQVQASLESRSEEKCLTIKAIAESTNVTVSGISILSHPAVKELDGLLKQKKSVKRKN
ncbi:helix-turn-helix domain-containing protein [Neisseria weixii]|uniref:DNA-binding protein n=1 Tax=Neisseria weixii TaxID=1853276 RepID=A0A3N4MJ72_9NEIS|nr:helix-turn-helix domain-containing protein [Neisseria weixii]ATD64638.1 XRE family transcriptional regulator [Neisseria weixii]RPD83095.1 DNA-binding protein [Neisseria weixii]RPD89618.1 DNA-binding protein [Neisseria weixii]